MVWEARGVLRFGEFELDVPGRELRGPDGPVHLEPQAFDLLVHLVEARERVVPKVELLDEVWGHRHVGESALTTRIKEVRRALGDDGARQRVVANVRGRGYRFVAAVSDDGATGPGGAGVGALDPSVVGRDGDVDGILERLGSDRLVSIVGPGGVGKTTVARQVVRHVREAGDPVTWVALAEVADPAGVPAAVAEALRVMAGDGSAEALADALTARTDLLVLDNCEHVVEATARLVELLLDRGRSLCVLTTSRERLGTSDELVWPLLPLGADEALQLFAARATAAGVLLDDTDDAVGRLVEALEGLPLALEMAAAQLPVMGTDDLEHLVAQRQDLLRSPNRGAPARHRTLSALVQWSLDLLDDGQRRMLADLTAFAGAVGPHDVAAVLSPVFPGAPQPDGLETSVTLVELAERSLLRVDRSDGGRVRYDVPDVVRSVVVEQAERSPARAERHARHFVAVAEAADAELRTPGERAAHDRVDAVVPELRAAHRWAADHDPSAVADLVAALHLFTYSRLWGEPVEWVRAVGHRADPVVAALLAADAANRSRLVEAHALATSALASGERRAGAMAHEVLADVALYDGHLELAAQHAAAVRRRGLDDGDTHLVVIGLTNLALTAAYSGREPDAGAYVDEMRALGHELAPSDRAWCHYTAAEVVAEADPAAALAPLGAAIELGEQVGNRLVASVARTTLAGALHRTGDQAGALDAFAVGLRESIAHGNLTHATTTVRNVVGLLVDLDAAAAAARVLAALEGAPVKATFGAEARRLGAATAALGGPDRTGVQPGPPGGLATALGEALTAVEDLRT